MDLRKEHQAVAAEMGHEGDHTLGRNVEVIPGRLLLRHMNFGDVGIAIGVAAAEPEHDALDTFKAARAQVREGGVDQVAGQ